MNMLIQATGITFTIAASRTTTVITSYKIFVLDSIFHFKNINNLYNPFNKPDYKCKDYQKYYKSYITDKIMSSNIDWNDVTRGKRAVE